MWVEVATTASPVLTGDPKAPTPSTPDNDTSIATTAYVQANLTSYAPKASPTFTGDPKAPTPATADNDTSIATSAFVKAQGYLTDAPSDGLVYGRKNTLWSTIIGGAVISDTPPPGPLQNGQLWYEADSGNTYIYYDDGSSQQWVQINIQQAAIPQTGLTAETRNRVVNGAMQISQENGDAVGGSAFWPADQWITAGALITATARSYLATQGHRIYVTTSAKPTLAAGDLTWLAQDIEGSRVRDFFYGQANAKASVLRFDTYCTNAGTYSFSLRNGDATRSFVAPFTVPASTWTTVTILIPGDTTGTWSSDTAKGLCLGFSHVAGSTYVGINGWQSGNKLGSPSATNGTITSGTFWIANVGLYLDPLGTGVPPRWQMPDEADELMACQRYWQRVYTANQWNTGGSNTSWSPFTCTMRTTPVTTRTSTVGVSAGITASAYYGTNSHGLGAQVSAASGDAYDLGRMHTCNARM